MSKNTPSPRIKLASIRRALLLVGVLCSVGSIVLGLAVSYRQAKRQSYRDLSAGTHLWANGCGSVFETARKVLGDLARQLPGKSPEEIHQALQQAIFDHPIFREAGWLQDGAVVCNSFGVLNPPKPVPPFALRTSRDPDGISFIPPIRTLLGGPSLIINRRVNDRTIVDVLISPNSFLIPLRQATKSSTMAVFLLRDDGTVLLASEGADRIAPPPRQVPPVGTASSGGGLVLCREIRPDHIFVVGVMPSEVFYARWRELWPVYGVASIAAAALFLLGAWQMRQRCFGLRAEIREAIALRQFQPFFQPVVSLDRGSCEGAEILVRWIHPTRGIVPPALFVPEAEAAGLIGELTLAMIAREAAGIRALLRAHPAIHLNLNLATVMLEDDGFLSRLSAALGDESLLPRFHFELTESTSAGEAARRRLAEFKALGLRLAVDDFGTGYSNLRYLKEFPFDYLKIDKAFVDGISSATGSSGLIDSIIGIGQNCELELIAEGVETAEQAEYLRRAGVQYGQGYYFSKPVPLADFAAWLKKTAA